LLFQLQQIQLQYSDAQAATLARKAVDWWQFSRINRRPRYSTVPLVRDGLIRIISCGLEVVFALGR
jgi:hypothetical protein